MSLSDFQFSFGLDPNFAIPVPLDIPPAPVTEDNSGMLFDDSLFQSMAAPPPPPTASNNGNTSLLNEDDQRIFTSFLDNFCMDQDVEPLPNHLPSLYDLPPSTTTTNASYPPSQEHDDVEEEERRRNSILRSLDEQKRMRHRILADAAVAAHHHQSNTPIPSSSSSSSYHHHHQHHHHHHASTMESSWPSSSSTTGGGGAIFLKKSDSIATPYVIPSKRSDKKKASSPSSPSPYDDHQSTRPTPARRNKPHKELLTEAEKRANHIASEQKRRTTIRTGFKDLTEIVPTLKNINNSKSTVLFKAVDYIRYLEKRTKHLHDKVQTLELRMQVEGRSMMVHPTDGGGGATSTSGAGGYEDKSAMVRQNERGEGEAMTNDKGDVGNNHHNSNGGNNNNNNNSTEQALRQHSMQQKHLMQLQEELQKKLLAHHRGFTRPVQEEMDVDEEPLKATVSA